MTLREQIELLWRHGLERKELDPHFLKVHAQTIVQLAHYLTENKGPTRPSVTA